MSGDKHAHQQAVDLRPPPSLHVTRAWHVTLPSGIDQTVTAHDCTTLDGVLLFRNFLTTNETVVVRAFGQGAWRDAVIVDTPASAAAHLLPSRELAESRPEWR